MMPVSTASVERSFSCWRRLKTYVPEEQYDRAIGSNDSKELSIHKDFKIHTENILKEFDATGARRVNLLL